MERDDFIDQADAELGRSREEPMSLEEFLERLFEQPSAASQSAKYVLDAIDHLGTRTVVEEGEKKERYRFFDDPYSDGEHAILGNTDRLNELVDDIRSIASGRGKGEKIIWIDGPTATGKSELKRCLINGLREYSKTEEGRRYTLEWNTKSTTETDTNMSYGEQTPTDEDDWYQSPVQTNPLSVFPKDIRENILTQLNEKSDSPVPITVDSDLDPFSQEAYDTLEEYYLREGEEDLFSAITSENHLRVSNYVVDIGQGIGVLHSEDTGKPGERLVGSWMPGMLRELKSRGRKNPQAFSFDGVTSQGNNGVTLIEDAAHHADLLQKMLNVPDEQTVKLDKGIEMDLDTLLLIISNPNLDQKLNQQRGRNEKDPLKALKRRLEKHTFGYLTNLSLEAQLLYRELTGERDLWQEDDYSDIKKKFQQAVHIDVTGKGGTTTRELAPHALEAAAMYTIATRLDATDIPERFDIVDKALFYDKGYLEVGDDRVTQDDVDFSDNNSDGEMGVPVTFTRDIIADELQEQTDRRRKDLAVENVVMPCDILDEMKSQMDEAPVVGETEARTFKNRHARVESYIFNEQIKDVRKAILRDKKIDKETVQEYVEHVYAWETDEEIENERGKNVDPDPLTMKVFEVNHLNKFTENDYNGESPTEAVKEFRSETVIPAINKYIWNHKDDDFSVSDINPKEIELFDDILSSHDLHAIHREYPDLDPDQWDDPPSKTQTEEVKEMTIKNMMEMFGYSRESAELTSWRVMDKYGHKLKQIG